VVLEKYVDVFRNANIADGSRQSAVLLQNVREAAALYVAAQEGILPPCAENKMTILIEEDLKWNLIPR
jgi:hypothetical protein